MVHAIPRRRQLAQDAARIRGQVCASRVHVWLLRGTGTRANLVSGTDGCKCRVLFVQCLLLGIS